MIKKVILFALGMAAISHTADAVCTISTDSEFNFITYAADLCPDPDPNYKDYVYLEVTGNNLNLTKPFVIPASKVHIKGNFMNGAAPLIIANYNIAPYYVGKGSPFCIFSLDGNNIVIENIKLDTKTYRGTSKGPTIDNAICIKGTNNLLNNVRITDAPETPSANKWPLISHGILVTASNNTLRNLVITLSESTGISLKAGNTIVVKNKILTSVYPGIHIWTKNQTVTGSTVKGKPAIYYEYPCDIPIGQAANIALLNALDGSVSPDELTMFENTGMSACKTIMDPGLLASLPPCGNCSDAVTGSVWKIPYTDSGSCQPVSWCTGGGISPKSGAEEHPHVDLGSDTTQEIADQTTTDVQSGSGGSALESGTASDGFSGQASDQTEVAGNIQEGTNDPVATGITAGDPAATSKPLPSMIPKIDAQGSGGAGCSLIR